MIDRYFSVLSNLHAHFGYVENWIPYPIADYTTYTWRLNVTEDGSWVEFYNSDGVEYGYDVFSDHFLKKPVYRATDHTMILVDTRTDGVKKLIILTNSMELT